MFGLKYKNKLLTIKNMLFVVHSPAQFCAAMIHRGEIVRKAVQESGISVSHLIEKIRLSRSQMYADFANPEMSFDRILAIGKVIHHDFSSDFKDLPHGLVEAVSGAPVPSATLLQECQSKIVSLQDQLIQALRVIDKYKNKYGPEPA